MRLTLVTPPAVEPVTLAEAKAHLRVDHDDDDALIASLITTARQAVDGRDGFLGRALIRQTWRLTHARFPRAIELPLPPLISIDEIAYTDAAGAAQVVDLQTVSIDGIGDLAPAVLRPVSGTSWPATYDRADAVAITFTAGYGDTPEDVPAPIKQAILLHLGHLYEARELAAPGTMTLVPAGYHDLLSDYRLWGF